MAAKSNITTDPEVIRKWAEERDGKPSIVAGTEGKEGSGLLRINFPGRAEDSLEDISWEDFFKTFKDKNLSFLYQDKTATGKQSRFNKFVSQETAKNNGGRKGGAKKSTGSKTKEKAK